MLNKFVDYYAASDNNTDVALGKLRQDPIYDTYFPGNKREDKTVRYNESEYLAVKENYKFTLEDYGINAELFEDTFSSLIAGDVSPSEFKTRIAVTFEGIKNNIPQVKEFYSSNYGIDLTDEAIFAAAIKPDIGEAVLTKQIAISQIGGEARAAGFGDEIGLAQSIELQEAGISQGQARKLFRQGQTDVQSIQELQMRSGRELSEEELFGIDEYTDAVIFQDPEELERIKKLEAEEKSRFSLQTGAARKGGRVTGLTQG